MEKKEKIVQKAKVLLYYTQNIPIKIMYLSYWLYFSAFMLILIFVTAGNQTKLGLYIFDIM